MNAAKILSPQQALIMQYLVDGYAIKEISLKMGVGESTINKYFERAKKKLRARTRSQAIAFCVFRGEVDVTLVTPAQDGNS